MNDVNPVTIAHITQDMPDEYPEGFAKHLAFEPLDFVQGTLRFLNESAIHEHALKCSARCRANRFTRVGQEFVDEVKADVEKLVRELRAKCPTTMHAPVEISEKTCFVTGALSDRIASELNQVIGRLIQNKVQRQPSCGKTLSRTR